MFFIAKLISGISLDWGVFLGLYTSTFHHILYLRNTLHCCLLWALQWHSSLHSTKLFLEKNCDHWMSHQFTINVILIFIKVVYSCMNRSSFLFFIWSLNVILFSKLLQIFLVLLLQCIFPIFSRHRRMHIPKEFRISIIWHFLYEDAMLVLLQK